MNIVSFSGGEEMDKKTFRKYRSDYSVSDLARKFANENLIR